MTGELSKEEQLQESLINWLLAGGNCAELVSQVQQFFQGVRESESCELDGYRAVELDRLIDSLEKPRWHAAKIDRNGGFPKLPPGQLGRKASAPIKVLVEMFEGVASCVRAEQPVEVHLWDRDVLDEQDIHYGLRALPIVWPPAAVEPAPVYPETKTVRGTVLHLLRVDGKVKLGKRGQPLYVYIPEKGEE